MKLNELAVRPPKIILYGPPGVGKTPLATTVGRYGQIIDMEDGLKSSISIQDEFTTRRSEIDVVQYLDAKPQQRVNAFNAVKTYIYGVSEDIAKGKYPYKCLILDSMTSFMDAAVNYIMQNSGQLGKAVQIQHWGMAFTEAQNVFSVLRSLPICVVLIAHENIKTLKFKRGRDAQGRDIVSEEDKLEIAIPGRNLPSQITRYFEEIWYMKQRPQGGGKMQYIVQTLGDGVVSARSRSCLPDNTDTKIGMVELLKKLGYDITKESAA